MQDLAVGTQTLVYPQLLGIEPRKQQANQLESTSLK
jgi:hypothetical protein